MSSKDELIKAGKDWETGLRKKTGGTAAARNFETSSGIPLKPIYTPLDWDSSVYINELGFPGQYPFTRGAYPTMYRGHLWTIRQYAGFGIAEETNRRFHFLMEKGQKGLSVAFDLPTQMGLDSDDPMARGEVGRVGVAVDSLEDMRILFKDIPLDRISTSMTINSTAPILLAMYISLAEESGVSIKKLSGTIQNDILKEYIARGTYIFPPRPSLRLITDTFGWCSSELPSWNPISISGYHIREAGATAVQEAAFTLSNAISYVKAALNAGMDIDSFAPRLSFFFNVHNDFLEEIAKFRVCRKLWAKIIKERFHARKAESMRLRFHTQTAGSTLTAQQPENNIARVTLQALAAVLGGTQSLHTNSYDEALGLPGNRTSRIALRTQQIIQEESGAAGVIDPLGGSFLIETLTDEIVERATAEIARIEEMGGMLKAIENGYPQREIEKASYEYQKTLESGEKILVGVNAFIDDDNGFGSPFRIDPSLEKSQVKRLHGLRNRRDESACRLATAELKSAAGSKSNLMPAIIKAVKTMATIGEISSALSEVFGKHTEAGTR